MKRILLLILCITFVGSLLGCETVRGIGKDLENTGENINEAVDKI